MIIDFNESLDHGLLGHLIAVLNPDSIEIPGDITISHHETRWSFSPALPWQPGQFAIHVDTRLEDLAGNNLKQVFDVDAHSHSNSTPDEPVFIIPFEIQSPAL